VTVESYLSCFLFFRSWSRASCDCLSLSRWKTSVSGSSRDRSFFEGVDCVPMVLDCALEVGFLGVLGGMVLSVMLVSGFTIFFRGRGVYFSQDYMYRVLKNFNDCDICSVSERLGRYFVAMKLCGESGKSGCDFGNFLRE